MRKTSSGRDNVWSRILEGRRRRREMAARSKRGYSGPAGGCVTEPTAPCLEPPYLVRRNGVQSSSGRSVDHGSAAFEDRRHRSSQSCECRVSRVDEI
jgi:hypothetical protein